MKKTGTTIMATFLFIISITLAACGGGGSGGSGTPAGGGGGGNTNSNTPTAKTVNATHNFNIGQVVTLDGSNSTDPQGLPLTYQWTLTSRPPGSVAILSPAPGATVNLTPDMKGLYTVELVVNNGTYDSKPLASVVTVSPPGMVFIPDGCFNMGDADGVGDLDEVPVHNVCLTGFFMDKFEMTNKEYRDRCFGIYPGPGKPSICNNKPIYSNTIPNYFSNFAYDRYPVLYVNQVNAAFFCSVLGKRLPTEAEWEYAARGGLEGYRYPFIPTQTLSAYANINWRDTQMVGSYAPNGYGLYDMAGNVAEWVNDWYDALYYESSPTNDPQGPPFDSTLIQYKVVRGGSWFLNNSDLRVASRTVYQAPTTSNFIGFRCVVDK